MSSRYGLEIRAAQPADGAGLSEMLDANGIALPARILSERIDLQRATPNGTVLLALEWGPPSGLVSVHWHPSLFEPHPVARITTLLVDREQRRRGIGRLLVKAASQAARMAGCDRIALEIGPGAAELTEFGAATGFAPLGSRMVRSLRKHTQS
ncbi:GNAT family N-acetyltransferase [Acetobacteraceae bacterium KSS8]|uniref:GNAT family N-acetyltransferase n=1 Tax=Endosaccharibacter trunci TaxID=2812733 RepID=A0ABT1W3S7_9PROT|nr:GNAT family N-acetyltransferase [Acetobacteraceae bacterium KSS8]